MAHDALKLAESKLVELKAEAAATLKETEDARRMELGRVIEDCCKVRISPAWRRSCLSLQSCGGGLQRLAGTVPWRPTYQ